VKGRLRRIAAAGNAAALALVVMAAGLASNSHPLASSPGGRGGTGRVLIVVIDALRADAAAQMPNLSRLRGHGTARVESWIPSTVAGVRSIVEGSVPPPASFLQDFGTMRPARRGGIFEGRHAFVAGPRIWADLYGPWLAGSAAEPTVGGSDERILVAGQKALGGPYDLVVVHLSGPDDAAHLHGGSSPEYAAAVRKADDALGRLLARAGPGTAVLVTSDHGVTGQGGHAGPEPEVTRVPVALEGPGLPTGNLGRLRQREIGKLLGLEKGPKGQKGQKGRENLVPEVLYVPWVLWVLSVLSALLALAHRLLENAPGHPAATLLNATLWLSLALALSGFPRAALLAGLAALAASPWLAGPTAERLPRRLAPAALGAGLAFGALRLLDASAPPLLFNLGLPVACFLGIAAGFVLGRVRPLLAGLLCGFLPALLIRFLGETASLSTLDTRAAFRTAAGPLGIPGAVVVVLVLQALPALAVLAGIAPGLHRPRTGPFAAGLALSLTGQGGAAALAIALRPEDPALGSLATGLLARLLGETAFLFLGWAAVSLLAARLRSPAASHP
jgi:hypothetical protein